MTQNFSAPDIGTIVLTSDYLGEHRSRVDFWMKAVPFRFEPYQGKEPENVQKMLSEIFERKFYENHPDWEYKYIMHYCTREEATHVACSDGMIIALDDVAANFTGEYVGWSQETLDEQRAQALFYVDWQEREPEWFFFVHRIIKKWHKHD